MNTMLNRFILTGLFAFSYARAVIFESDTIRDILPHIDNDTLVIFDLDDTLIRTPGMLGSDSWFRYNAKQKMLKGNLSFDDAVQVVLPLFFVIHMCTELEMVDPKNRELITELQQRNQKMIALTSRSPLLAERTKQELIRLGIDLSIETFCNDEFILNITHTGKYSSGIIFCGNNNKGKALFLFLEQANYKPSKIIFVDDKYRSLEHVDTVATLHGIPFVGIRYSGSDERKKQFDPVQAERELIKFKCAMGMAPLREENNNEAGNYN